MYFIYLLFLLLLHDIFGIFLYIFQWLCLTFYHIYHTDIFFFIFYLGYCYIFIFLYMSSNSDCMLDIMIFIHIHFLYFRWMLKMLWIRAILSIFRVKSRCIFGDSEVRYSFITVRIYINSAQKTYTIVMPQIFQF